MIPQDFKDYVQDLLQEQKFKALVATPASENKDVQDYLYARGIQNLDGIFSYSGDFTYQDKTYTFENAVVFPFLDLAGELQGVQIREINRKFYMNLLLHGQKFWICKDFNPNERCYMFEGVIDALSFMELGYKNCCASIGVSPTADMLAILPDDVVCCFDNDKAGKTATIELLTKHPNWSALIIKNKEKDMNDILLKSVLDAEILKGISAVVKLRSML